MTCHISCSFYLRYFGVFLFFSEPKISSFSCRSKILPKSTKDTILPSLCSKSHPLPPLLAGCQSTALAKASTEFYSGLALPANDLFAALSAVSDPTISPEAQIRYNETYLLPPVELDPLADSEDVNPFHETLNASFPFSAENFDFEFLSSLETPSDNFASSSTSEGGWSGNISPNFSFVDKTTPCDVPLQNVESGLSSLSPMSCSDLNVLADPFVVTGGRRRAKLKTVNNDLAENYRSKRVRNNDAARRCRLKKKQYEEVKQKENEKLMMENAALKARCSALEEQVEGLKKIIASKIK